MGCQKTQQCVGVEAVYNNWGISLSPLKHLPTEDRTGAMMASTGKKTGDMSMTSAVAT